MSDKNQFEAFILKAKMNGWANTESNGKQLDPSRLGSFDISYSEGDFFYQDTFVGGSDFAGQEHVCKNDQPVWSMVYFGKILEPKIIDGKKVIEILRAALGELYRQGRFLGSFDYLHDSYLYRDSNSGSMDYFEGAEEIFLEGECLYKLKYFGGMIRK